MKRAALCVLSVLALAAACGGRSTGTLGDESSEETLAVNRITLRGALPPCSVTGAGKVYYVVQEEQLVYCDGESHQDVALDCAPTWLVSADSAASCARGGLSLSTGADENANGKLDPAEVVASATVCNGAHGAPGAAGSGGTSSSAGSGGAPGVAGSGGAPGVAGSGGALGIGGGGGAGMAGTGSGGSAGTRPTGEDMPCSSSADCAGFEATFCDTFVTGTCLVSGCTIVPDSCSAGKECCDLSSFGLPPLCIAAGACAN